jgi:hypothetical protein
LKWIVTGFTWQGSESDEVSNDLESKVYTAGAIVAGAIAAGGV